MTTPHSQNALLRTEHKVDMIDRKVNKLTRRVAELERQQLSRKAILAAVVAVGPLVTSAILALIALGDRLWGP